MACLKRSDPDLRGICPRFTQRRRRSTSVPPFTWPPSGWIATKNRSGRSKRSPMIFIGWRTGSPVAGSKTVVMESTGVYWIPVYDILEQRGFEVMLVNARDAKHVPGRKTDVSDAQWLQRLHEYGLLRASFRPQAEMAGLRAYLRQRERLLDYAAAHIQHMQKALMQMNLQLHHVVSDITGATGMRIIRAIVAGERDPTILASYRDVRCHSSVETVRRALVGNDREEHIFALTQGTTSIRRRWPPATSKSRQS
jgi:Transposase